MVRAMYLGNLFDANLIGYFEPHHFFVVERNPRRRGLVVIASAYITEDPEFESRQGMRFLGMYTLQCCCHNLICIVIVST
jgi:hypothetical protein